MAPERREDQLLHCNAAPLIEKSEPVLDGPTHVLIVDDDPVNLKIFEGILARSDRQISVARSGEEALAHASQQPFAVVLLDVQMPGMDGYQVADRMRNGDEPSESPIIFITASKSERGHIFQGYETGAVDYLIKPVDPYILRSKVEVFCQLNRLRRTVERQVYEIAQKNRALEEQLAEIKTLQGLLPICSACKKIKGDDGYWEGVEAYLRQRTEAKFTHSFCPDCLAEWYPDFLQDEEDA